MIDNNHMAPLREAPTQQELISHLTSSLSHAPTDGPNGATAFTRNEKNDCSLSRTLLCLRRHTGPRPPSGWNFVSNRARLEEATGSTPMTMPCHCVFEANCRCEGASFCRFVAANQHHTCLTQTHMKRGNKLRRRGQGRKTEGDEEGEEQRTTGRWRDRKRNILRVFECRRNTRDMNFTTTESGADIHDIRRRINHSHKPWDNGTTKTFSHPSSVVLTPRVRP